MRSLIVLLIVRYHGFPITIIVMNVIPCLKKDDRDSEADDHDLFLEKWPGTRVRARFWDAPLAKVRHSSAHSFS